MSAANLTFTVEPRQSGSIVYLPLAPAKKDGSADAQLSLRLDIKNNESQVVKLTSVQISFPGSSVATKTVAVAVDLQPATTGTWYFQPGDNILLPLPAPGQVRVRLTCAGFTTPNELSLPLAAHKSAAPTGGYRFPALSTDLRGGELWRGRSAVHGAAGGGIQLYAYDMGVMAWDSQAGGWSEILPGKAGDKNDHWRIYGKPVYAMAAGTVVDFLDGMAENTKMGTQVPTPNPVEGNHFYLQHGEEELLYAHLQPGSLNPSLKKKGTAVAAGQFLGLAGNSGNSTNPHLHIHGFRGTVPWGGPLRGVPFDGINVVDETLVHPPDPRGPWVTTDDQGLPSVRAAIWPYHRPPVWEAPDAQAPQGLGIVRSGSWASRYTQDRDRQTFLTETQKWFDDDGLRLTRVQAYMRGGSVRFAGIARSGDWANRLLLGFSTAGFLQESQKLFDQQGLRLVDMDTWVENGQRRWAGIARSGTWASRVLVDLTADVFFKEAQQLFDEHGLRMVRMLNYVQGGQRLWAGIARSGDWASRLLADRTWAQFRSDTQHLFDNDGLRLIDAVSYVENGQRLWAGIARSGDWANFFFLSPNLTDLADRSQRYFDEKGYRLEAVEIFNP